MRTYERLTNENKDGFIKELQKRVFVDLTSEKEIEIFNKLASDLVNEQIEEENIDWNETLYREEESREGTNYYYIDELVRAQKFIDENPFFKNFVEVVDEGVITKDEQIKEYGLTEFFKNSFQNEIDNVETFKESGEIVEYYEDNVNGSKRLIRVYEVNIDDILDFIDEKITDMVKENKPKNEDDLFYDFACNKGLVDDEE